MKKATLQTMHDQSIDCSMKLNWAWAIARLVSVANNVDNVPKWAVTDSIEAIDHLIGEAKTDLAKMGIAIENELNK